MPCIFVILLFVLSFIYLYPYIRETCVDSTQIKTEHVQSKIMKNIRSSILYLELILILYYLAVCCNINTILALLHMCFLNQLLFHFVYNTKFLSIKSRQLFIEITTVLIFYTICLNRISLYLIILFKSHHTYIVLISYLVGTAPIHWHFHIHVVR